MQPAVDQDGWWGAQDATAAPPAQSHDGPRLWSDEAGAAPVEHTPVQSEALPGQQHRPMMPPASQPSYPTQNGYPAQRGPPAQPKSGRQPLISQEESFRRSGGGFVSSNRGGGGMGGYGGGQGYGNGGGGYRQGPPTYQGNGAPYQQMQQPRFNHAPPPMRQYDLSRPPSFPPVETMQHGWGGALDVTPAPLPFVSQVNPHAPAFIPAPPPVLAVSPVVVDRDFPPHQSPDLSSPKSPLRSRQTSPVQPLQPAEPLVATLSNDGTRFWSVEAAEDVAPAAPDKSTSSSRWACDAPVEPTVVVRPALAVVAEPSPIAAGAPQDDWGAPAAAPIEAISTPFEDSPRWWSEEPTAPAPAPKPASASRPPPRSQSSYSNGSAPQGRPSQGQGRGGFAPNGRGGGGGRGGYGNVNGQGFPPNGQQQGPRSNNQQQQQQQQQRYNPSQQQSNPSSLAPSETTQEGSSGEGQSSPSERQTSIGDSTVPSAPSSNSSRSGPPVRKQTRNVTSPASFPSQPRSTPPVQSLVRVDELATTLTEDGARFWSKEATEAEVAPAPVVQTTSSSRWATEAPVDAIRTPAPPAPAPAPVSCAPKVTIDSNEAVARTAPKVVANASTLPSAPVAIPVEATAADVVAAAARRAYPDRNRAATGGSARAKMTPAELDEKMRLMKQKNAAIQARADAINAERKIEEQLAALEERAAREAKVASDLLQEQHRAENEQREATRNAERELVRTAALEKKTRTDQMQARINEERRVTAERKLARVEGRDWDREKMGSASTLTDANYPSQQPVVEPQDRLGELDQGVERRDGWESVIQPDAAEEERIAEPGW